MKNEISRLLRILIASSLGSLTACELVAEHELVSMGSCYVEKYTQPTPPKNPKIDLLFVVDSSGSLLDEKTNLANGIDALIGELPADSDYRIAVMLAHGSKSSRAGVLFKAQTEPYVLDSKTMTLTNIRANLKTKLLNTVNDYYSDGGEEGLYSLNLALDPAPFAANQAKGFFRSDATLAVVFVADENDICAEYPTGVTPIVDPEGLEIQARQTDCVRSAPSYPLHSGTKTLAARQEAITPSLVYEKLKDLQQDRPLVVSAIVYNDLNSYPKVGENEYGYGYMDLVRVANGISVDLASNLTQGLSQIGKYANTKITYLTEFPLTKAPVEPSSIAAKLDGASVPHTYNEAQSKVLLNSYGQAGSVIEINYCLKQDSVPTEPICTGLACGVFGS